MSERRLKCDEFINLTMRDNIEDLGFAILVKRFNTSALKFENCKFVDCNFNVTAGKEK
jgi:hypothetical protein